MYKQKDYNTGLVKKISNAVLEKLIFLIFIAHGMAHLVGLFIYWKIMPGTDDTPYKTKIFFSEVEIGTLGVSILGFTYLVLAVLFVIAGILLIIHKIEFSNSLILVLIFISLVVTLIDLMPTIIGFFINVIYLITYIINKRIKLF